MESKGQQDTHEMGSIRRDKFTRNGEYGDESVGGRESLSSGATPRAEPTRTQRDPWETKQAVYLWVIAYPQVDGHVSNTLNGREGERPRVDPGRPYSAAAKR